MDFMEMLNAHLEESKNKGSSGGSSGGEISAPIYIGTGHEAFYNNPASRNAFNKISTRTFDAPISQKFTSSYKKKKKEEEERKWFEKGLFEDGYDFGDISRTILGSTSDVLENIGSGIIGMGEKAVDAMAYIAPYAANSQFYQNGGFNLETEKAHRQAVEQSKKDLGKFITKDLYDEEKVARAIISDPLRKVGVDSEAHSVFGEKSDALIQSGGQLLATAGLSAAGMPWWLTTGVTSFGGEAENAMNQGATYEQAGASAAISAGAEILSEKLSGGISFGGKTLDDALTKQLARGISNKLGRTAAKLGLDMVGEGAEEVFSQVASNLGSALYKEEDITELLFNEEAMDGYLESFIGGAALGGVSNTYNAVKSNSKGVDYTSGLTQNEQKVVDKLYKDEVASREKEGKITQKEKSKIYDSILENMEKGYISVDTIEEVLGGDTYTQYKEVVDYEDAILKEYDELGQKTNATLKDQARYSELTERVKGIHNDSTRKNLKSILDEEVYNLVKGDRLAESYNERARTGQKFEADVTQYDAKQQAVVQKAIDSGILNNSRRTHEFVDFVSKISADTGVLFDFSNTQKIREAGFAVEGQTVDGFITKDGITVNIDSPKSRQFVVGHEITHALEGTELYDALRKSVFDYARMKNQYGVRMESIQKRYKEGTDFEAELTADLVGEYIFSDTDFINNLSAQNRNVFQKVYDEIKYLCKVATAGSKEARELEKVKRAFEKAYREGGKVQGETKYSLTDTQDKAYQSAVESGELGKAQSLVDNRAYTSGYNIKLHHGTAGEPFYVFRQGAEGIHFGTLEQATERAEITAHRYGYGETDYTTGEIRKNLGLFPNGARRKIIEDIAFDGDVDLTAEEQDIVDSIMDRGGDISDETLIRFIDKVENEHGEMNFSLTNRVMQKDSGKRVISAYVKAKNPLVFSLDIGEWTPYQIADLFIKKINGETAEVYDLDSHRFVKRDPADITEIELTAEDIPDLQRLMQSSDFADMAQFLQDKGYDCIRYLNTYEGTKSEESYILLSPEQVKSADTVTYDDSGNVVPLSQRFNAENNDIRYSLSEVTEEQNQKGLDTKSEISYSISNDTKYADSAIALNEKTGYVSDEVMTAQKLMRERVATRLREMVEKGVALPKDKEGDTFFSNSSYGGSEENTTICPRSLAPEAFMDAVSEMIGRPLTVNEQIYVSQDLMNRMGSSEELRGQKFLAQCVYCYVAADRMSQREFLGEYINQRDAFLQKVTSDVDVSQLTKDHRALAAWWKDKKQAKPELSEIGKLYQEFLNGRKPTGATYKRVKMWLDASRNGKQMIDGNHLANIDKLVGDISQFGDELKPQIQDAWKYAQMASWAKKRVGYVAYNGHIQKWTQKKVDDLNKHYGLRMYSFSDFHPAFVLENMQMVSDAAVRGLKMLGYTKDIDFVDIFAPSGMNINVSTFGFEKGGSVYEDNRMGAEWKKAQDLRAKYPNVGITFVATNDAMVKWAMKQDWIDVVIPYHIVKTGEVIARHYGYQNYTAESSDVKTKDWKKGNEKYIAPPVHNNDLDTYISALEHNGLEARFKRFLEDPETRPYYMKLVNECRQSASESKPVQPIFNEDAINRTLAKLEAEGYYTPIGGSVDRMYEIAGEVADAMTNELAPAMSLSNAGEQHTSDSLSALRLAPAPMKTEISDYAVGLIRFATDGNLTWGKVRQIIDRPEYREAFEEVTGITLKGSRSEQKRQVMNEAEELYRYKNMVQDIVQKSTPVWTVDNLSPVLPDEPLTIYTDERFQPLLEVMTDGKMTFAGAKTIANSSSLRSAFESLYGIELPKTNSKAVPHIISLAEDVNSLEEAYNATQMSAETGINSITDAPVSQTVPETKAPVSKTNIAPTVSKTDDIAPLFDATGKKGVPDGQQAFMPDAGENVKQTRKEYHQSIIDRIKSVFKGEGFDFDKVLKNARNLSTWSTVDNTPQRVMEKALGYKQGGILADITVNKVAQNETEGIKWLNAYVDQLKQISKQYGIKPGSKESAAAQMYAEGFYVNENNEIVRYGDPELIQDFGNADVRRRIKGLARDPRIRKIYDDTLANINESRTRNLYPEIPRLDNYFLHFRAMSDTFSTLGLPFNPNDIRAKDLPTDLNGVTADLKPGQPYFASANHRTGKRTSFDLLGGVERYLTSAKNQIYHIDDIQTLRALRNYIAETYGQATGLEDIDSMTDAEAEERIKQVYDSHLSTFAKFLNEEANVLAGKTALIDRGIEGIIGRRGITFLNSLNKQVGSNMVGYNVSSSLTNFLPVAQTFAKTNKFDFTKAFAQTVANKLSGGRFDSFAEDSPVVIRRKGEDRFYRTLWQKLADPGYAMMGMVDDISTEIIARTKYNEFTRKGMDSQKAHFETDKWVSKLMGDRSLGQQPQLYNSKMLGLVTKFQLEVRNQLDSQFYDTIQETKVSNEHIQNGLARNAKTAAKVASVFTQLAVAQHLYGMAFESIAGYNPAFDIIEVLMTAFGFDDEEDSEDTLKDNLGQGFEALMEDLPYASIITGGGRIPISSALPIKEFFKGEDQYGNEKSRWKIAGEVAPYYLMPGGYGQLKKTTQGLKMFSDDHPIAGSYTDAGNLRYDVEDTVGSRIKAGIFGQYASENAQKYFDQEQRTLNPEQTEIFAGLNIPIEEYWEYRDNLYEFYDVRDALKEAAFADEATDEDVLRYTYINNAYGSIYDLYDKQKEIAGGNSRGKTLELRELQKQMEQMLSESKYAVDSMKLSGAYGEVGSKRYNKDPDSGRWYEIKPKNADGSDNWYYQKEQEVTKGLGISYEEYWNNREEFNYAYDKPGRYAIAQAVGGYDSYMEHYDVLENWQSDNYLRADKDKYGNSIDGSRKKKVLDYISGLDLDYGERIILYRTVYSSKSDKRTYNQQIIDYLNERDDISYQEMKSILEELDMVVDSNGYITW